MKKMVLGMDASWAQGSSFDWKGLEQTELKYAIIKATDGLSVDKCFERNQKEIRKTNLILGHYHWFQPSIDPIAQAEHFVRTIDLQPGDLPPSLDFEDDDGGSARGKKLLENFLTFMFEVERLTGRRAIVYTGNWFWKLAVSDIDSEEMSQRPLWHAQYPGGVPLKSMDYSKYAQLMGQPTVAKPWSSRNIAPAFWQFDGDKGLYSPQGIDIDVNIYYGDMDDLNKFIEESHIGEAQKLFKYNLKNPKQLQQALIDLGYDLGSAGADGIVGKRTTEALKSFQGDMELDVNGSADHETMEKIKEMWFLNN